jgi:hypothetical protein
LELSQVKDLDPVYGLSYFFLVDIEGGNYVDAVFLNLSNPKERRPEMPDADEITSFVLFQPRKVSMIEMSSSIL